MLHVEKMASIGKMAAVVAHEINNPLSGILTYSQAAAKVDRIAAQPATTSNDEAWQCLDLIAGESRRCGDLVQEPADLLAHRRR